MWFTPISDFCPCRDVVGRDASYTPRLSCLLLFYIISYFTLYTFDHSNIICAHIIRTQTVYSIVAFYAAFRVVLYCARGVSLVM